MQKKATNQQLKDKTIRMSIKMRSKREENCWAIQGENKWMNI